MIYIVSSISEPIEIQAMNYRIIFKSVINYVSSTTKWAIKRRWVAAARKMIGNRMTVWTGKYFISRKIRSVEFRIQPTYWTVPSIYANSDHLPLKYSISRVPFVSVMKLEVVDALSIEEFHGF